MKLSRFKAMGFDYRMMLCAYLQLQSLIIQRLGVETKLMNKPLMYGARQFLVNHIGTI